MTRLTRRIPSDGVLDEMLDDFRRMVGFLDNRHYGLASWNIAVMATLERIVDRAALSGVRAGVPTRPPKDKPGKIRCAICHGLLPRPCDKPGEIIWAGPGEFVCCGTHGNTEPVDLRDRFAMAALQGLLNPNDARGQETLAFHAYQIADAMLEARKQ